MVEQLMSRELTQGGLPALLINVGRPVETVAPEDIRQVMDERLCQRGRRVYAARVWKRPINSSMRVHVWRVGSFLGVMDADYQYEPGSIDRYVLLVDAQWQTVGLYGFEVVNYPW